MAGHFFDRVISAISPATGLARAASRRKMAAIERAETIAQMYFDGASSGARASGWRARRGDANASTMFGRIERLADVSADMARNEPWARRLIDLTDTEVIGGGILPSVITTDKSLRDMVEESIRDHLESTAVDADGLLNLSGLQGLAVRTVAERGEVIIRRRFRRSSDGLPLPFQIQVLEPDYIDKSITGQAGGFQVIQGVAFDAIGRRVGYYMFSDHPGNALGRAPQSQFVSSENVRVMYRVDRPGQVHGVPWLATLVVSLKELHDYEDAALVRQKIAACFAAFIKDDVNSGPDFQAAGDSQNDAGVESLSPGTVQRLPQGKDIVFGNPPRVDGHDSFVNSVLRRCAAGWGVTYESFTGDYSQVNFSSGRMGRATMDRSIGAWQNRMVIPQMCMPVGSWFREGFAARYAIDGGYSLGWTPPRRILVDPAREIKAMGEECRLGFQSRSGVTRSLGRDPTRVEEEIEEDEKRAATAGLKFTTSVADGDNKGAGK